MDKAKFYASFASVVYQKPEDRHPILLGFKLAQDFNGVENCTYVDDANRVVIHCSRGTARAKDLVPDLHILIGTDTYSKRMSMERKRLKKVFEAFPNYKIYLTGHSLGGRIVINLIKEYEKQLAKAVAFNPGTSVSHAKAGAKAKLACTINKKGTICKARRKTMIYAKDKDIISILSLLEAPKNKIDVASGFHSIGEYL